MLLVKTDYETAKQFECKNIVTKIGNKKQEVYLKVYCDDTNIKECVDLCTKSSNILVVEYRGVIDSLKGIDIGTAYVTKVYDLGMNIMESDVQGISEELPTGLVGVLRLPKEYKDMRFIYEMSNKYKNIRFCGGSTFCLDGCRLGCCGRDILESRGFKMDSIPFSNELSCCALEVVDGSEVELKEGSINKSKVRSKAKAKQTKKKSTLWNNWLYDDGVYQL